jgi:acetyl-CoA acetyltransferase
LFFPRESNPSRTPVIVGVSETPMGDLGGRSSLALHADAVRGALADAGLTKADVDGVLSGGSFVDDYLAQSCVLCEYLGIEPDYTALLQTGGASSVSMVLEAAVAIYSGLAQTVVVVTADNMLSGLSQVGGASRDGAIKKMASQAAHPDFEMPFGPTVPALYSLLATRHMHEFGTTSEQLAQLAVNQRRNALMHPGVRFTEEITVEDVTSSRLVAGPLHLLDCALVTDGGGALVLTSAERAKDLDKRPVGILGAGVGSGHEHLLRMEDLTSSSGARNSGRLAMERAGVTHDDLDVLEIYDPFTIALLIFLEDLGFCEKGEGGRLAESEAITMAGKWPLNTNGGLLSYAHGGISGGIIHPIEAVRQLRGEAGKRQVADAELALVHGNGGVCSSEATAVFSRL